MEGEKKEMPTKRKNKKTRNEPQKDDCLTCLSRWTSCHEAVGWRTSQSPRVQRPSGQQLPSALRQLMLTNCHGTSLIWLVQPASSGVHLAPSHREADLSNVSAISIIAPKDGRCKKLVR